MLSFLVLERTLACHLTLPKMDRGEREIDTSEFKLPLNGKQMYGYEMYGEISKDQHRGGRKHSKRGIVCKTSRGIPYRDQTRASEYNLYNYF